MTPAELLIKSAETIEALTARAEAAEALAAAETAEKVKLAEYISNTKTASEKTASETEKAKAELAPMAKVAADKLYEHGLFATTDRRDEFAAKACNDHNYALDALAKVASHVTAPNQVTLVKQAETEVAETADDVWVRHASTALASGAAK